MMVLFVSQCEKKALVRTRKVLDAFANRIGDSTWQTVITEDGLQTVRQLLRQTASKSTAVSCHWVRSRSRSDLLWIVGNRRRFNSQGIVPVNRTRRNLLHSEWENDWQHFTSIQIIATLTALLHDLGKSTIGFQKKLRQAGAKGDPYRHEWISLKIVEWLLLECQNDSQWLQRLADIKTYLTNPITPLEKFLQQNHDAVNVSTFPPLAQWVAWLIVTHHRTATFDKVYYHRKSEVDELKNSKKFFKRSLLQFYKLLKANDFWVKNPNLTQELSKSAQEEYWRFEMLVLHSTAWQKALKRWANKALQHQPLIHLSQQAEQQGKPIDDTLLLHFSRLCLMMADYHYSGLGSDDKRRVKHSDQKLNQLAANTDRKTKQTKQALDEHLLGVAQAAAHFARVLSLITAELPTLKQQDSLIKNTGVSRFVWQNKAFQLARTVQPLSQAQGFFGVNMASTGCGKTIGNARIMYALADREKGARFTVALGLRVLTLQTGQSYRENLGLNAEQLAILVGGSAQRKLYEMLNSAENAAPIIQDELTESELPNSVLGSESADEIVDGIVDSEIDYSQYDNLNLDMLLDSQKAEQLLFSPVAVCTVDHLIQASECKRGGKYMLPLLRLLSSDLILDEPDDFDQADLPALSRLVHLTGLLGGRILLSSATLPPDLIHGLFKAYLAGRTLYHSHQNKPQPNIVCAWIDEQAQASKAIQCSNNSDFIGAHLDFIAKRVDFLQRQSVRRRADILPLNLQYQKDKKELFFDQLARLLAEAAFSLHRQHHIQHPQKTETVSIGLIRIANTKNIIQLAEAFNRSVKLNDDVHIHLCCYHAKQLLLLRNMLESCLDRTLKRDVKQSEAIFEQPDIQQAMRKHPAKQHIFIVLATPVAEVGRDHDYDWAIVEPSSMRSIIQLAGRIWRHRPDKIAESPNLLILQKNIRALQDENIAFTKPGFESEAFKLSTHDMAELMPFEQRQRVDSIVRISKPHLLLPDRRLADLEHQVIKDLLNNEDLNFINAYWDETATANRVATHLQILTPFRAGRAEEEWLLIPEAGGFNVYSAEQLRKLPLAQAATYNYYIKYKTIDFQNPQLSAWLSIDLNTALEQLQQKQSQLILKAGSLKGLAINYSRVALEENEQGWSFNQWLGFWRNQ